MRPRTPAGQSTPILTAFAAAACLFVIAAMTGCGPGAAPAAAPASATPSPSAAGPAPAPPLTTAQQAVLTGKLADFVSQFAKATGIKLVPIPAGKFTMGSPPQEAGHANDEIQHPVTLTKDFFLGATDVTQAQWKAVMGGNPAHFTGDTWPVETVSWDDAVEFCKKLTAQEQAAGRLPAGYTFTLPTEAQWEYACRAGTTGPYAGDLGAMAWYADNSGGTTHPVATKQANAWGLFDMHGNVWEWCSDWYGDFSNGAVTDPTGPASGSIHVCRGGSWHYDAAGCRSAFRYFGVPGYHDLSVGFRLAVAPSP
jgi:formylglycine-generating enzyme required for sulfatase activity